MNRFKSLWFTVLPPRIAAALVAAIVASGAWAGKKRGESGLRCEDAGVARCAAALQPFEGVVEQPLSASSSTSRTRCS